MGVWPVLSAGVNVWVTAEFRKSASEGVCECVVKVLLMLRGPKSV